MYTTGREKMLGHVPRTLKPDGHCQFDELERYMREEIEKPEKERRETENTFIDGVRAVPFTVPVGCIISSVEDLKAYFMLRRRR